EAKDRPALLRGDRAMAFAYEQMKIAQAELLAQAEWALEKNEFEAAIQLYEQALKLDHTDGDARAGKRIAQQLKEGKLTRAELRKRTRAGVEDNPDLSDRARRGLADRLQDEIRNLAVRGEEIRRTLTERARATEIARENLSRQGELAASEDRVKERMKQVNSL